MAFTEIGQPENLGERCELARKTCDELSLDPAMVWIDGMNDQSRALFGDLPSPAIVVDPLGVVRAKLPWAEPEAIEPRLKELLASVGREAKERLESTAKTESSTEVDLRSVGAALYVAQHGGKLPPEADRQPAVIWAAAMAVLPEASEAAVISDSWLALTACAKLATELPKDSRWNGWVDRLVGAKELPVQHWALQMRVEHFRQAKDDERLKITLQQLDEMRRASPWLVGAAGHQAADHK